MQEVNVSLANAKAVSVNPEVVAVLSELGGIFAFKKQQSKAPKALLGGQLVFHFIPNCLWQEFTSAQQCIAVTCS